MPAHITGARKRAKVQKSTTRPVRETRSRGRMRSPVLAAARMESPATAAAAVARRGFPPIADYAFVSDCEVNALIAPNGSIEWLCLPRHDSPSVFAALLDREAGRFRVGPAGQHVPTHRAYVPGSLVLETVWQTATGWLVVRDALCMTPWRHDRERTDRYVRAPSDWEAAGMIVRTLECTYGHVDVELLCSPFFEYGSVRPAWSYSGAGYSEAVATAPDSQQRLHLATDMRIGIDRMGVRARTLLEAGQSTFVAVAWGDLAPPRTAEETRAHVDATVRYWQRWLDRGTFPDHPWKVHLQRSALTVKGLTYSPTGALVAAATTSLPETPGGERNWDYRYSWLRDTVYTLAMLYRLGYDVEARDYTLFLSETVDPIVGLQIMYGIGGERKLEERELPHLSGYEGARPVRVGNGAYDQKQHDTWGNFLGLLGMQAQKIGHVPEPAWRAVKEALDRMSDHWREPDRGIWEVRGEPQHFVSSKVMCWFAAYTGARIARMRDEPDYAAKWDALAAEIKDDVCEKGVDERGVFMQHYGSTSLDASNLLMTLLGFLPPEDPRLRATVLTIADELSVDGLVLRYQVEQTDDGLSGVEGTFCICSFWLVSALVYIGEIDRARRLCEKLLTFASPLGLYAEEIDATNGRHLGNFPQAFSHLSLALALTQLIDAETKRALDSGGRPGGT